MDMRHIGRQPLIIRYPANARPRNARNTPKKLQGRKAGLTTDQGFYTSRIDSIRPGSLAGEGKDSGLPFYSRLRDGKGDVTEAGIPVSKQAQGLSGKELCPSRG